MAKKKFNIGMAALGALAGGMGGKYIFDKYGNKSPVAKKAAEAKADASSKPASETKEEQPTRTPPAMTPGLSGYNNTDDVPKAAPVAPAPAQAQVMMPPAPTPGLTGYDTDPTAAATSPNQFMENSATPGYRRGGVVARKSVPSKKGLSVRGGGKATKGLGKVRMF